MNKNLISFAWKFFLIIALISLLMPILIYADGWTNQPSHQTLYADTITSKTDGSSVNIADSQGLFVTGDVTTLGKTKLIGGRLELDNFKQVDFKNIAGAVGYGQIFVDNSVGAYAGPDGMAFFLNGAGRMAIKSDGNVGIGTTNPTQKLVVNGRAGFGDTAGLDIMLGERRAGGGPDSGFQLIETVPATNGIWLRPGSIGQPGGLWILNSGNVGIGTTGPTFSIGRGLHIAGISGTPDAVIRLSEMTSGLNNFEIRSTARGTSGNRLEIGEGIDTFLTIRSDDDGGGTANRGNVGIGTPSPGEKLTVAGNAIVGGTGKLGIISLDGDTVNLRPTVANGDIWITDDSALSSRGMVIANGGNVGIGTTRPGAKLHVSDGAILLDNNQQLQAKNSVGSIGKLIYRGSDDKTYVGEPTFSNDLVINPGGNVGIGTTNPGNILTIQQNSATDPIADAWTVYSSGRWKNNITTIGNALGKVERLRGVYFNWNSTNKHDVGMIAEEVGKVIPEAVVYEQTGKDAISLDYARLTPILIEAIKELKQENDDLKAANSKMEARIAALESKMP